MGVRVCSLSLVILAIFAALMPVPDSQPIPISDISVPTVTVIDAGTGTIEGVAQRQGTQTDHAGVEVIGLSGDDGMTTTVTTAAGGGFGLALPMSGTYTVNASYPGYLRSQKGSVCVVSATMDIGPTTLVAGNVNADNCINILDIVSIISKFGLTGLPASDPEDINDDGTINILDLTVAAGNFTRCGPTVWAP